MRLSGTAKPPSAPRHTPWKAEAGKARGFDAGARSPDVWSLGYCDVIDGRLHIVPKAIAACAGGRGIGSFAVDEESRGQIQARITAIYDRVRTKYEDWPASPFAVIIADAS